MKRWTIKAVPVTGDSRIFSVHVDCHEDGLYYVINGTDGYNLDEFTPEEAEQDYLSPEREEERTIEFMRAYGFYD